MRVWFSFILLALLVIGVAFFVSNNPTQIQVVLAPGYVQSVPLWMALLLSMLLGAALSVAFFTWPLVSLRLNARRSRKRITELEQEVHGLRTLPLNDDAAEAQVKES